MDLCSVQYPLFLQRHASRCKSCRFLRPTSSHLRTAAAGRNGQSHRILWYRFRVYRSGHSRLHKYRRVPVCLRLLKQYRWNYSVPSCCKGSGNSGSLNNILQKVQCKGFLPGYWSGHIPGHTYFSDLHIRCSRCSAVHLWMQPGFYRFCWKGFPTYGRHVLFPGCTWSWNQRSFWNIHFRRFRGIHRFRYVPWCLCQIPDHHLRSTVPIRIGLHPVHHLFGCPVPRSDIYDCRLPLWS